MNHVTINDLAKITGYSKSTISAALNNKPEVSDKVREYIVDVSQKMGYIPSELARSLSIRHSKTIGLVVNDITNPFFNTLVKAIENVADKYGYTLLFSNTNFDHNKEVNAVNSLIGQRVAGIIVTPLQRNVDITHLRTVQHYEIPLCLIGKVEEINCYSIDQDDWSGSMAAMEYLFQMGHKRIAYITGPDTFYATQTRFEAYQKALENHNIAYDPSIVIKGNSSFSFGYDAGTLISQMNPKPTAVFCFDDQIANGLFKYYSEKGLKIPDEISIVGFNNSVDFSSKLTTVNIPIYEMGKKVARYFFECLEAEKQLERRREIMATNLVIRESVRNLRKTEGS